tara:strand:+ start:3079 stop:4203 length:1125 start_codon:yes stop_codon:yes gene_type:complete
MILAIDASNIIIESGGFIHLRQLLENYNEKKIKKIYVFSSKTTIEKLKIKKKGVIFINNPYLNRGRNFRIFWQLFLLNRSLKKFKCSALFVLGGYFFFKKIPTIVIIQNLLPFIKKPKYNQKMLSKIKNFILKPLNESSIKRSDGVIFLSNFSKKMYKYYNVNKTVIPHGIENKFLFKKNNINYYNNLKKFRLLYLSKFEGYKNHDNIVKSVYKLLKQKYSVSLTLVGIETPEFKRSKLYNLIDKINKEYSKSIIFKKLEKHKNVHRIYRKYDLHVFGSMCESFGIIILETIASSLPIVCSNFPVFKEILGKYTLYFDANNSDSISKCIKNYLHNNNLKIKNTKKLFMAAKKFTWKTTTDKTFNFIIKQYEKSI